MNLSVSEAAKLSGVSVRTLHYYDEIGLLKPSAITESGYRFYDETALELLQQILFYRELDFSLKEIQQLLSHPGFSKTQAFKKQKQLLQLKKNRLNKLIRLVDDCLKGENYMNFEEFDLTEIEAAKAAYAEEISERWGGSTAYNESIKRTNAYTKEAWREIQNEMEDIFDGFAALRTQDPASAKAQELTQRWHRHLCNYYFNCTSEILAGLGTMYFCDERFKKNIDKHGEGTAEFMSKAIAVFCAANPPTPQ